MHIAAANAYVEVLEFLLENDADIDVEDKDGWKPIHAAACWGNERSIELLVEHGAELESRTPRGEAPLDLCEEPETRQFIIDLKNKIKTNKFQVKNIRKKRSNSRSLSVKRSSLKEKISISQNEAKAEAILRQHPELAFLITNDKKTENKGPEKVDVSVKSDKVNGEEKLLPHTTTQQEDKRSQASDAMVTESSKPRQNKRTSEIREGNETKLTGGGATTLGIQEKAENKIVTNATNNTKSSESVLRGKDAAAPVQDTLTTNVQSHHKVQTKEFVVQSKSTFKSSETIIPPSCEPSRSQITGHRQLPVVPRLSQPTRENASNSYTNEGHTETTEKRTSFAKPSSGVSSQSVAVPKSTEAHPAPTAPRPRSSGSTTAPVVLRSSGSNSGRSQDTSGYPDSFHKRKSRDSREINDTTLNQLAKEIRASKAVSSEDVHLSSQVVDTKYTPKATTTQEALHNATNAPATQKISSETTANQIDTKNTSNDRKSSLEEPKKKFTQPNDVTVVEGQKKSCCVLV